VRDDLEDPSLTNCREVRSGVLQIVGEPGWGYAK
jgi:hypothetical protein